MGLAIVLIDEYNPSKIFKMVSNSFEVTLYYVPSDKFQLLVSILSCSCRVVSETESTKQAAYEPGSKGDCRLTVEAVGLDSRGGGT